MPCDVGQDATSLREMWILAMYSQADRFSAMPAVTVM